MCGLRELRRAGQWHESALAHDSLRMSHPIARLRSRVLRHGLEDLLPEALVLRLRAARAQCDRGEERRTFLRNTHDHLLSSFHEIPTDPPFRPHPRPTTP